ncbi:MAG: hypothetical protein NT061_05645 [Spirochaetes bacterium]|nr:hypothetical protein [Spirochaetota bacterium]
MDKSTEAKIPQEPHSATGKAVLVFKGAGLASVLILMLAVGSRLLFSTDQASWEDSYLRVLALISAFGFCLASWGIFFLGIMNGFLGLAQVKPLPAIGDFLLALLSLVPLALILAAQKLASGFGP